MREADMRHISGGNGVYLMVSGLLQNPVHVGNQGCKRSFDSPAQVSLGELVPQNHFYRHLDPD